MLELSKKINGNGGPEIGLRTNEGEILISYENGNLYVGCIEKNYQLPIENEVMNFNILEKDSPDIYGIFNNLIIGVSADIAGMKDNNPFAEYFDSITLDSDEFDLEETSFISFERNEESKSIKISISKTKSKGDYNSYFVTFKNAAITNQLNNRLLTAVTELLTYTPDYKQITIDDIKNLYKSSQKRVRTNK